MSKPFNKAKICAEKILPHLLEWSYWYAPEYIFSYKNTKNEVVLSYVSDKRMNFWFEGLSKALASNRLSASTIWGWPHTAW